MKSLSLISDSDLLALMPSLVLAEHARVVDVIEHLMEIDRRRLFLGQACSSLSSYCIERLGYSKDEASKRVRVARLASRLPQVLDELRAGAIHLTGLFLLSHYLTQENHELLLSLARGQPREALEQLIAERFPKPDLADRVCPLLEQTSAEVLLGPGTAPSAASCPGTDPSTATCPETGGCGQAAGRVQPLSASRCSVQFTASAELPKKIERARELLSHALPSGELGALFERAIDALIERETKRRLGANKPRKRRALRTGSRHVPVEVARQVWERDGGQCTFVDEQGRRCSARRFLTLEHRHPYALGGPPTVENLTLFCAAHNAQAAREVFGEAHIESKRAEREESARVALEQDATYGKVQSALCNMGFKKSQVRRALDELKSAGAPTELEPLLRAALQQVVP